MKIEIRLLHFTLFLMSYYIININNIKNILKIRLNICVNFELLSFHYKVFESSFLFLQCFFFFQIHNNIKIILIF
jgi:hypothetical protein